MTSKMRTRVDAQKIEEAVNEVLQKGISVRSAPMIINVVLWCLLAWFTAHLQLTDSRMEEMDGSKYKSMEPQIPSTEKPKIEPRIELKMGKCFHMSRDHCPTDGQKCTRVDPVSVFCCDVDSFRLKEALAITMTQNTTNLHVLNATIDELDLSQSTFRRLTSMALTDGNIGKIVDQFRKHAAIVCLNISNNNLSSETFQSHIQRPFAYLYNLTVLDASANNLTEIPQFPHSLAQSKRMIRVDLSGNNYLPCKQYQKAIENNVSSPVKFLNENKTFCALGLKFNWFKDVQVVPIEHLKVQNEMNERCHEIRPADANCTCVADRLELVGGEVTNLVAVDCSKRHLKEMPTNLPLNTVKLNVSYNNITSLQPVSGPSYEHLRQLFVDHNDIANIVELEGTKFIDNFMLFSLTNNKLKTIHTYVLSNRFDAAGPALQVAGNHLHCDCNTEKVLKPWLLENSKNIPDYKEIKCEDNMGAIVDLKEFQVCHTPRDWTDYIYYIIGLEVLVLVLLISKVSYDYWVFKTAGYLPWPANKMPRLPCDWLCE